VNFGKIFAAVHTLSFGEAGAQRFVTGVTTALNCRHRGARSASRSTSSASAAGTMPLRPWTAGSHTPCIAPARRWRSTCASAVGTEPICEWAYALVSCGPGDVREEEGDSRHDATNMDMRYEMAEGQDDEDYDASADDDGSAATDDSAAASDDDLESDPVVEETRSTWCREASSPPRPCYAHSAPAAAASTCRRPSRCRPWTLCTGSPAEGAARARYNSSSPPARASWT